MPTSSIPSETNRLVSLDVFRGITIAGMVLVNNPGTWSSIYWPLQHAEWHGWTPTDLVFPFFLFIVGVAIPLAFGRRLQSGGSKRDLYWKVVRRTLIIFALGIFLAGFPYFQFSTIRIPGVLQRIAVCYLFASIIFLNTKVRTHHHHAGPVNYLLAADDAPARTGLRRGRFEQRRKSGVVRRSRYSWSAHLETRKGLRSGRATQHDTRYRYHAVWSFDWAMAARRQVGI